MAAQPQIIALSPARRPRARPIPATPVIPSHPIAMATLTLRIDNMHCGACVRRVTQTLNALPHTHAEEVRVGSARVSTDAGAAEIEHALTSAGYPASIEAA